MSALEVPRRLPVRSLSVSSLARFERCQEQWRRHYVLGEREPQSLRMSAGKALGAALAAHYAARIAGERLTEAEADDRLLAEFDLQLADTEVKAGDDAAAVRESCREPLRAYLAEVAPKVRPLAVERKVEARFPGAEWSFVGYLDLETEDGTVVDYKLSERHVTDARAKNDPQATAYLMMRALEGAPASRFEFHSGRRGKIRSGERWRVVPAERSESQLEAFQERVARVARAIARCAETGDWMYSTSGWWCGEGSCHVWHRCPAGGRR